MRSKEEMGMINGSNHKLKMYELIMLNTIM